MTQLANTLTHASFMGNELWRIALLFGSLLVLMAIGRIARLILRSAARRVKNRERDLLAAALVAVSNAADLLGFTFGLRVGMSFLVLDESLAHAGRTTFSILFVLCVTWILYCLVDVVDHWLQRMTNRTASTMDDMLAPLVRKSVRVTLVVLALLQVATMLSDKPLTSVVAGLGVGGLAVALAAQETVKNFFGSLVIFADKPFLLGDRVLVDGFDGAIEEVGFRSTRLRTLDGQLVTIPNGELANKSILNISKRPYIKRVFNVTITYDTPPEKVKRAIEILKEILHDHEGQYPEFPPQVYFNDFNDCSLNILVIYWFHPPDYWAALAFGEHVNIQILERFNSEGIEFAFPTRTLFLASDPQRPLNLAKREEA